MAVDPALGIATGFGHLKRCIAIATELVRLSHTVDFIIQDPDFDEFIDRSKFKVRRSLNTCDNYNAIIVDRYDANQPMLSYYKKRSRMLIKLDDSLPQMKEDDISDVIINGNPYGKKELYEGFVRDDCLLLVGAQYVPMDNGFCIARKKYKVRRDINKILITFGQSINGAAFGRRIYETIFRSCSSKSTLQTSRKRANGELARKIKLLTYIEKVYKEFVHTDIAICSSSSICWQLACVGIPFFAFKIADNQVRIFDYLLETNMGIAMRHESIDNGELIKKIYNMSYDQRKGLCNRGRSLIDCKGAHRIASELVKFVS